jgi:hypothetical protein
MDVMFRPVALTFLCIVAETAAKWGLVGTWQEDCKTPPTRAKAAQVYSVQGGKLFLGRYDGQSTDSNQITSATINTRGEIEVMVVFTDFKTTRLNVHAKDSQGRRRMMQNKDVDTGEFFVADGILKSNGVATPSFTRCR